MSNIDISRVYGAQPQKGKSGRRGANSGFTLIELLVVIAIIALLAAILFPVFAAAREKARQTSCASNMKQITLAILQYAEDVDGKYPPYLADGNLATPDTVDPVLNTVAGTPASIYVTDDGNGGGYHYVSWMDSVYPFIKNTQVFLCPSHNKYVDVSAFSGSFGAGVAGDGYKWVPASYGVNGYLFGFDRSDPEGAGTHVTASQSTIQSVASKVLLIHNSRELSAWTPSQFYQYVTGGISAYDPFPTQAEMMRRFFPHSDGQVIAYADGHVEWKERPDIAPFTCDGNDDCVFWKPTMRAE